MIKLNHITKRFESGDRTVTAVDDVSLAINAGEVFGIIGFSGAGKSTLVRCINLLERPTSGEVIVDGVDLTELDEKALRQVRQRIGMIFQHFNLMPSRTVTENIEMPLKLTTLTPAERKAKISSLLELVELSDKADAYPSQLSGGQKQRVAIARALANDPKVLLCDEATSALDPKTTQSILKLLREVNQRLGITIVVITHQMSVVKYICDRAAVMEKGRVVEEGTILEIFSHPKMPVTKGFIDTATNVDDLYELLEETRSGDGVNHGQTVYLLTYTGSSAGKPLMVELYQRFGVEANIIFGATISDEFQDEMRVTVIATGFEMKPESFAPSAGADKTARPGKPSFVPDDIDTPVAASKQPTKPADMSDIDEIFSIFKR